MTAPLTAAKIAKIEANAKLGACGYPTNADDVLALCEMARQAISAERDPAILFAKGHSSRDAQVRDLTGERDRANARACLLVDQAGSASEEIAKLKAEHQECLRELMAISEALGTNEGHSSVENIAKLKAELSDMSDHAAALWRESDALVKERDEARARAEYGCAVFENDESCEEGKCWDVQAHLPVGLFVGTIGADGYVMDASVSTGTTTKRGRPHPAPPEKAKGAGDDSRH